MKVYTSGMYGSLDTNLGENISLYMALMFGRNSHYPCNGVTMSQPQQDDANSKRPNFENLTPKASSVIVDT
jgi:hypothetical protein